MQADNDTTTLYVLAHPSRRAQAEGYAAGLHDEEVEYEVVINDLCPPDKFYVMTKPQVDLCV